MDDDYSDEYLRKILTEVKAIAVVGASSKPQRDSYRVIQSLIYHGYKVIPVNPNEVGKNILGLNVYSDLDSIDEPVDMVDVFRSNDAVIGVTGEAIRIGAKVLWTQLGIINKTAANIADRAGLKVVMNRCPAIELSKPYWVNNII